MVLIVGELLLGKELYQKTIWFWAALMLAYFPVLEAYTGRTLGRVLTRTVVVDGDGNVPGLGRAMRRTLLRLIEVNPVLLGGVPAGIVLLCSKRHQRLGDMWAGTYVLTNDELAAVRQARANVTVALIA